MDNQQVNWVKLEKGGRLGLPEQGHMRVPVELFFDRRLLPPQLDVERLKAIASRPGVVGRVALMPDFHFTEKNYVPAGIAIASDGILYPALCGPANDGMCAVQTSLFADELSSEIVDQTLITIRKHVALFRRKRPVVDEVLLRRILATGIEEIALKWGYTKSDLERLEYGGRFPWGEDLNECSLDSLFPSDDHRPSALPSYVPDHSFIRAGRRALGVIDGGSHFWELVAVDCILDGERAALLDLEEGQVLMTLHAGAGDLGLIAHRSFFPDDPARSPGLPADSGVGEQFKQAMATAAHFGWANRLYIMVRGREALSRAVRREVDFKVLGDVSHDLVEPFQLGPRSIILHRKGAARAIPAGSYRKGSVLGVTGLPFYFPSSVGGEAYIMSHPKGNPDCFFTCSHGAGRFIDKDQALKLYSDEDISTQMDFSNVRILRYGFSQFSGQAPLSFKNMELVLEALKNHNLAEPIVRLRPLGVLKP